ncbi:uncharacterized protein A4U43_C07F35880 [Asparagus officinalis]|uniref:Zinc-finger domain-containing protein n=1 Tax=Asparagus officinalis TaxID=4686 RepID=A0A5P1EJG0_ASPOF|nr:cell division cycle-associated 7-like protein [Asparagus officinalis]ONK65317.1 uncharacterized protein A4U43_C07F35880 [Asparagus officinalis]
MGRLRAKQDYESLRNAQIARNKAILESHGLSQNAREIPAIVSSSKSISRVKRPTSGLGSPIRRSGRLGGKSSDPLEDMRDHSEVGEKRLSLDGFKSEEEAKIFENKAGRQTENSKELIVTKSRKRAKELKPDLATPLRRSHRLNGNNEISDSSPPEDLSEVVQARSTDSCRSAGDAKTCEDSAISDYESIRNARISANMAKMASLGLDRGLKELQNIILSSAKTYKKTKKPKMDLGTPRRRSDRLKGKPADSNASSPEDLYLERSERSLSVKRRLRLFSNLERCRSKERGSIYDPVLGICCHFCRQKKLCGEEDCKRCGDSDINQPCIGKTECSVCHSPKGVLCRACLKVRYGEEMEEVKKKKDWMCPHCTEEKGINPYWICNSSLCLKKRKMAPTGIAIYQARAEGYESVAHLIMDKLKQKAVR